MQGVLGVSRDDKSSIPSEAHQNLFVQKGVHIKYPLIYTSIIIELLATDPLSVDQHLKVVREATWEVRAKWQRLGEELGVTIGKLQVRKCDINNSDVTVYL